MSVIMMSVAFASLFCLLYLCPWSYMAHSLVQDPGYCFYSMHYTDSGFEVSLESDGVICDRQTPSLHRRSRLRLHHFTSIFLLLSLA